MITGNIQPGSILKTMEMPSEIAGPRSRLCGEDETKVLTNENHSPWKRGCGKKYTGQKAVDNLITWVAAYEIREDEYGLKRHRALFDTFTGKKREYRHPDEYK
jgi:hypothetical protein